MRAADSRGLCVVCCAGGWRSSGHGAHVRMRGWRRLGRGGQAGRPMHVKAGARLKHEQPPAARLHLRACVGGISQQPRIEIISPVLEKEDEEAARRPAAGSICGHLRHGDTQCGGVRVPCVELHAVGDVSPPAALLFRRRTAAAGGKSVEAHSRVTRRRLGFAAHSERGVGDRQKACAAWQRGVVLPDAAAELATVDALVLPHEVIVL